MNTTHAEQVANAILYEGYVLYPYRASAQKNRARWNIGLLTPRAFAQATDADPWFMQTECVAELRQRAALTIRIRCLHVQERRVERRFGGDSVAWRSVDDLTVGTRRLVTWDEAVASEFLRENVPLEEGTDVSWQWTLAGSCETEDICDTRALPVARIVRCRQPVQMLVRLITEAYQPFIKIRVRVENLTPSTARTLAERDAALKQSVAGIHAILALEGSVFESLLEPSAAAAAAAASCINVHTFPVLADTPGARQVLLSSPIILYDYPAVAPESAGDLYDSTEIDELLTLRVRTLTEGEKNEARATDPRAASIISRCDTASPRDIAQLHGTARSLESLLNPPDDPRPEAASLEIDGVRIRRGSHVRLRPTRVADSLDLCLNGRTARVAAVYRTIEDEPYVAVTLDDDPFGTEGAKYRRSLFFRPDELMPVAGEGT